jgi:hypothetical protein
VVVRERSTDTAINSGFIVDQWSITGKITQEEDFEPVITQYEAIFDYDAYKILRSFMTQRTATIQIVPYTPPLE